MGTSPIYLGASGRATALDGNATLCYATLTCNGVVERGVK